MNEANKPVISNRDKLISISIFEHNDNVDGHTRTTYGASLQRAYQRPEQKGTKEFERQSISLYPEELLRLAALCVRTYNDAIAYAQANKPATSGTSYPAQEMDNGEYIPF